MSSTLVLDLTQTGYTHKKFGTRSSPPPTYHIMQEICENQQTTHIPHPPKDQAHQPTETATIKTRSKGDIFRPYALEENSRTTSQKRKHQELQDEDEWLQQNIHAKRYAAASPPSIASTTTTMMPPHFLPPMPVHVPYMPLPFYGPPQYQFNAQALAVILQKQQAALCLGAILKRQPNFNLYNIIGN